MLAITLLLLIMERAFHVGIFDPKLGGDPVLFQHFFWFYSHPAVYIMIVPGMASSARSSRSSRRRRSSATRPSRSRRVAIALVGFLVWGHHMFVSGQSSSPARSSRPDLPRRDPLGRQGLQLDGDAVPGLDRPQDADAVRALVPVPVHHRRPDGLFLGALAVDMHLHDTYFVVAHFHYVMMGGTVIAFLGGLHYWWPKMIGSMYNEKLGAHRLRARVHRLQRDVLHPVHPGQPRHAAPLLQLPAAVPAAAPFSTFGSWILGAGLFLTAGLPARDVPQADGRSGESVGRP